MLFKLEEVRLKKDIFFMRVTNRGQPLLNGMAVFHTTYQEKLVGLKSVGGWRGLFLVRAAIRVIWKEEVGLILTRRLKGVLAV